MFDFDLTSVDAELITLIVCVCIGFFRLSHKIGERSKDLEALVKQAEENKRNIEDHEKECVKRENATREAFAEGSTKMAILDERTGAMQRDLTEIKETLKSKRDL